MWILFACLGAFFCGLGNVVPKRGLKTIDPGLATVLSMAVVLVFSWLTLLVAPPSTSIAEISPKSALFLALAGIASGTCTIFYFKALQMGDVNRVIATDKFGTVITVLFGIFILGEQQNLWVQLLCAALLVVGAIFMTERKSGFDGGQKGWRLYAWASALLGALSAIFSKVGVSGIDSNLATALRTSVICLVALIVVIVNGKVRLIFSAPKRELLFILLSGPLIALHWLFYFKALQMGPVSVVTPIDRLSILVCVAFARIFFRERLSKVALVGLLLVTVGTVIMALNV